METSALFSIQGPKTDSYETKMVLDSDHPGVFEVLISLPKTLREGYYDLELTMGGQQVPSPVFSILPCTNTMAANLGWVSRDRQVYQYKPISYVIEQSPKTVDLSAAFSSYCEY